VSDVIFVFVDFRGLTFRAKLRRKRRRNFRSNSKSTSSPLSFFFFTIYYLLFPLSKQRGGASIRKA